MRGALWPPLLCVLADVTGLPQLLPVDHPDAGMDMMMPQMMAGYGMQAMQAPQGFKPPPPRGPPPPNSRH